MYQRPHHKPSLPFGQTTCVRAKDLGPVTRTLRPAGAGRLSLFQAGATVRFAAAAALVGPLWGAILWALS